MIIAANQNGLCNRLKALLSVMHLSQTLNTDYGIYWEIDKKRTGIQCKWGDLFENNIDTDSALCGFAHRVYDSWRFAIDKKQYSDETNQQLGKLFKGKIDFQYEKAPLEIVNIYRSLFAHLIPIEYVVNENEKMFYKIIGSNCLHGIHIRSWGDSLPNKKECWKEGMKGFNINNQIKFVESIYPQRVFVACDNEKYLKILIDKFGDRIICRQKRKGFPGSKEQLQDALIDLYSLRLCSYLVLSYYSTFSDLAWCISYRNKPTILGSK